MTSLTRAFFSALDADSEHEEGKFYVWHRDEVRSLLTDEEIRPSSNRTMARSAAEFRTGGVEPIVA